jgi:hydrogenase maturation protein HypF
MNPLAHSTTLPRAAPARVLACGAFLKNRACLIDGDAVYWSALHGDLDDAASRDALAQSIDALRARASGPLQAVAHDLHPDFFSTHIAQTLAQALGVPVIGVQHHHAHIGVVLAEQAIAGPVIGLALDGMGFGSDGGAWGGEVLWVDGGAQAQRWRRLDHLACLALPGGDAAARQPWRLAAAVLFALGRGQEIEPRFAPVVGAATARLLHTLLQRGLNCPPSSSAGRWFDAAAGALGVSVRQRAEAKAAMALEQLACNWLAAHPDFEFNWTSLDLHPVVAGLFALQTLGPEERGRGAAQFHLALAGGLAQRAIEAAATHATRQVMLAGGCLVNRVLSQRLRAHLSGAGLTVRAPQGAGYGDAGLALGQAWIAGCTLQAGAPASVHAQVALEV